MVEGNTIVIVNSLNVSTWNLKVDAKYFLSCSYKCKMSSTFILKKRHIKRY